MKQKLKHTVKPSFTDTSLLRRVCFVPGERNPYVFPKFNPLNRDTEGPYSLRKQPTFGDATTCFPVKWRLRNEHRNSILITRHHPDLGSASDWSYRVGNLIQPIRSTTQIRVMMCHQYGISVLVSQTSFGRETSGSIANCRLFSQARGHRKCIY